MKKTLTVNLNGIVFNIDEDAYQALKTYLNEIGNHFVSDEEKEIINDIEARIAELFGEKLQNNKSVVDISDVENVIKILGHANQFESESSESEESQTKEETKKKTHKRFYRDPENAMLGGIAGGVAAYLNWDTTLVRILFVILVFVGFGWAIPIYLLIWLIAPEARTTAQRLEMQGKDVTVDAIKEQFETAKDYVESDHFKQSASRVGNRLGEILRWLFKVLFIFVSIVIGFVGIVILAAIVFALIIVIVAGKEVVIGMLPFTLLSSPFVSWFALISVALLIIIPILAIIIGSFRLLKGKRSQSHWFGWTLFATWIIALFCVLGLSIRYLLNNDFDTNLSISSTTETRLCEPFHSIHISDNMKVKLSQGDSTTLSLTANDGRIGYIQTEVRDSVLYIALKDNAPNLHLLNSDATISITTPEVRYIKTEEASSVKSTTTLILNNLELEVNKASKADLDVAVANLLIINASEASKVEIEGLANKVSVKANNASKADLEDLKTTTADVEARNASKVEVGQTDNLWMKASDASKITYQGNPVILQSIQEGMSTITSTK